MPAFHEVLFPTDISYGSQGGPKFKTTVFMADSGYEQRNIDWKSTRAEYDVSHGIKRLDQMHELTAFFFARMGRAFGFRFKDFNDFHIQAETIAIGDGTKKVFQVTKTYTSFQTESGETYSYSRNISKIAWGTLTQVTVGLAAQTPDVDYSVDENTGIITFTNAPPDGAAIKIGYCEFHVPVRFDTDHLDSVHDFWNTQSWSSIPLVEVRDWGKLFQ